MRLLSKLGLIAALLLGSAAAFGQSFNQNVVTTNPFSVGACGGTASCPLNLSSSVAVSNTFQSIFAANVNRKGCTVQNLGTSSMFVFFGPLVLATTPTSFQLTPGNTIYCAAQPNSVVTDQVNITGTSGALFSAVQN
jgi:hypothetical protein